jgi:HEPN domain-containing protein
MHLKATPPLALAGLLALGACQKPPTREIAAAEASVDAARKAGADRYAVERWREAEGALQAARDKIQAKDYRGAISSANEASEKARSAVQAVQSARALARSAVLLSRAEIEAVLEEVEAVRQEASTAKVPDEAFAEIEPQLAEAREAFGRIGETLDRGEPLEAQKGAAELKAQSAGLPEAFRQARAKWEEEHPAKPARRPPRRQP